MKNKEIREAISEYKRYKESCEDQLDSLEDAVSCKSKRETIRRSLEGKITLYDNIIRSYEKRLESRKGDD